MVVGTIIGMIIEFEGVEGYCRLACWLCRQTSSMLHQILKKGPCQCSAHITGRFCTHGVAKFEPHHSLCMCWCHGHFVNTQHCVTAIPPPLPWPSRMGQFLVSIQTWALYFLAMCCSCSKALRLLKLQVNGGTVEQIRFSSILNEEGGVRMVSGCFTWWW